MTEIPLVSIIIPCYNSELYISEAIKSALNQTYPNIELIVINDGSTDKSYDLIKSFGEKICWVTTKNQGGAKARNKGLGLAKGEFIKFLDADDILLSQAVESQINQYKQLNNVEKNVVYGDVDLIANDGTYISKHSQIKIKNNDEVLPLLMEKGIITSSPLHKKEFLLEINGFNENLRGNQEHDLHIRLYLKGIKFKYFPTLIYHHRIYKSKLRISQRDWCYNDQTFALDLFCYYEKMFHSYNINFTDNVKTALANRHIGAGRSLLRAKKKELGKEHFQHAMRLQPNLNFKIGNRYYITKYYLILSKFIGLSNTESFYYFIVKMVRKLFGIYNMYHNNLIKMFKLHFD